MFLCFQKTSGENISCLSNCWVAAHTQYLPGRGEPDRSIEGNIGFTATTIDYILYYFRHEIFVNVITHHMYHVEKDCLHSRLAQMCTSLCSSCWLSMGSCLVTAIWISGSLHIFISQCVYTLQSGCCSIHYPLSPYVVCIHRGWGRDSLLSDILLTEAFTAALLSMFQTLAYLLITAQPTWMMETGPL